MNKLKSTDKYISSRIIERQVIVFLIVFMLVLIDRILFLNFFSFKFTGSDQMIFWQSATDYMNGVFHEPYFYGQNYNFMLESVFAIPLLKMGISYYYAFPIVTSALALFPYIIFAYILYRKSMLIESLIFLSIPLLLPIDYEILTSITRGFVTGLFFSGFLVFCLMNPQKKYTFVIFGSAAALGYIFNPNSLIFVIPIAVYLFLRNYNRISYYLISLISALPFFVGEYFAKQFYDIHIEYKVHWMWKLDFSFNTMIINLGHLDKFFDNLSPVLWFWGWLSIVFIFLLGLFLIRKDWKKGISVLVGILFIVFLLGVNKVNDGMNTIFLSSIRMFLGVPLLLALTLVWSKKFIRFTNIRWTYIIILASVIIFIVKICMYKPVIEHHTTEQNYGPVAIKKVDELKLECSDLTKIVNAHKIDLMVFIPDHNHNVPDLEFYNYGCPLLEKEFTQTMLRIYERRTWVFQTERSTARHNILLYGEVDPVLLHKTHNYEIISDIPSLVVIKNNHLKTEELMDTLGILLQRNAYY